MWYLDIYGIMHNGMEIGIMREKFVDEVSAHREGTRRLVEIIDSSGPWVYAGSKTQIVQVGAFALFKFKVSPVHNQ